jgi:hypothetical protein
MSGSDEEQDIFRTLVGFQIEIFAATGLASSHSTPFLRVSFTNSKSKQNDGHNFSPSSAQVQVFQSEEATHLVRQHGRIYTAIWNKKQKGKASESNCTFFIPKEAKYVDLQLWNGFEEFDLFLGTTRLSLKKRKALSKQIGWYPLQMSNDHGLSTLQMSIQARVTNLYDAKDMHSIISSNNGKHDLVDPTFRFTKPFLPIEWSRVVSTSIRHLFFHVSNSE